LAEPTIAAGFPKALLVFAVARGADRSTLLQRSGLASQDLAEPDSRVPLARYMALFQAAAEICADPAIALRFGECVRMQDICVVGLICEVAETAADVGRQLNRYSRLIVDEGKASDLVSASLSTEGLWMAVASEAYNARRPMIEAELARLVCNTRASFRDDLAFRAMRFPRAVHFTFPEPSARAEYERIFQSPLVFGAERNALLLDPAFPLLRQEPSNREVFTTLCERADTLLKTLHASHSVRARVESLLIPLMHTGDAGMEPIASRMGVTRRTLLRRLKAEGTTFEMVLDELRHAMALRYLSEGKVSANETAYLVGFSEPAAFSRAFKRWTGVSPGAFREGLRA